MKFKHLIISVGALFGVLFLASCDDDGTDPSLLYPNALVTVKEAADETVFFQLDENTTLLPVNITSHPYNSKEVRALVNYKELDDPSQDRSEERRVGKECRSRL